MDRFPPKYPNIKQFFDFEKRMTKKYLELERIARFRSEDQASASKIKMTLNNIVILCSAKVPEVFVEMGK